MEGNDIHVVVSVGIIRLDMLVGCHESIPYGDVFDVMDDSDHDMDYNGCVASPWNLYITLI